MASPFKYDKKERRRARKFVRTMLEGSAKLQASNPEIVDTLRRAATTTTRIYQAKRHQKNGQSDLLNPTR